MLKTLSLASAVLLLSAAALFGQTHAATVSGVVKDTSGGVIPGAKVFIINVDTNVSNTVTTNAEGLFTIPDLIPGNYRLTAAFPGMKRFEQNGMILQVGDRINLELVMQVGSSNQLVTVTGETPLLRTADVESGLVVDTRRIEELPEYDRNPLAFALLTPNVNSVTSEEQGYSSDFRINGGRTSESEYFVDGIPVTTGYLHNVPAGVPGMEAVAEFKVITNGMSAEYGRLSGGAVTIVTKAGTNGLHGSAYEFFQNQVLNASDWNSNRYNEPKGAFHNNIYGFAVGGPVRFPKLYNGANRTFFFLNYEGTKFNSGSNAVTAGVPTDNEKAGDFSQTLNYAGTAIVTVSDPTTGQLVNGAVIRTPFANDQIPGTDVNPLSKIYLGLYPEPNHASLPGSTHNANWIGTQGTDQTLSLWTGRLDENENAKNNTHFSYIESSSGNNQTMLFPADPWTVSANYGETVTLEHDYALNPTTVVSLRAGVVREVTTSGSAVSSSLDDSAWPLSSYMRALLGTTNTRIPQMSIDSDYITTIGGGQISNSYETDFTFLGSLQKIWGKQTMKFGLEHRRYYANVPGGGYEQQSSGPEIDAVSPTTNPLQTGSGLAGMELGYLDWGDGSAVGGPASLQTYWGAYLQDDVKLTSKFTLNAGIRWDFEPPRTERWNRQIYWDKNYKWPVVPNAGWSWSAVETAAGVSSAPLPSWLVNGYEQGRVAMLGTPDYPGRVAQQELWHHFAPRVGFAWEFLPKTVLRVGYGINWLTTTGGSFLNGAPWNLGYGDFGRFEQGGTNNGGLSYQDTFNNPMPGGQGFVPNPFAGVRNETTLNDELTNGGWFIANAWDQVPGMEQVGQVSLQREVGTGPNSWVFEASLNLNFGQSLPFWLGKGEHILPDAYNILGPYGYNTLFTEVPNPVAGQVGTGPFTSPPTMWFGRMYSREPFWQEVWTMGEGLGASNYYAGYVQAQHRFGKGFSFLINYTVAKMLQDCGGIDNQFDEGYSQQGFPQAGLPFSNIWGLAPTDITHKVIFNYSWDLPVGRGRRLLSAPNGLGGTIANGVAGGWRVAGTTTFHTGTPVIVYNSSGGVGGQGDNWYDLGMGRAGRPITTGVTPWGFTTNGHAALQGSANEKYYFNQAAFTWPTGMEIGNLPPLMPNWRNPGFAQWDFAVMKNFPLFSERRTLQFRFESQNLFNHMNAGTPIGDIGDSLFGVINSQVGNPRRIMVAAKILF
jgi:hypothetical protein